MAPGSEGAEHALTKAAAPPRIAAPSQTRASLWTFDAKELIER
jgi:hypothetical protein